MRGTRLASGLTRIPPQQDGSTDEDRDQYVILAKEPRLAKRAPERTIELTRFILVCSSWRCRQAIAKALFEPCQYFLQSVLSICLSSMLLSPFLSPPKLFRGLSYALACTSAFPASVRDDHFDASDAALSSFFHLLTICRLPYSVLVATEMFASQRFLLAYSLCCLTILAITSAAAQMQQSLSRVAAAGSPSFAPLHHFRIFNAVHHVQRQWGGLHPAQRYSIPAEGD